MAESNGFKEQCLKLVEQAGKGCRKGTFVCVSGADKVYLLTPVPYVRTDRPAKANRAFQLMVKCANEGGGDRGCSNLEVPQQPEGCF